MYGIDAFYSFVIWILYCRIKEKFLLVVCVAVFFGVVAPGSKSPWIQSINLHEKLKERARCQNIKQCDIINVIYRTNFTVATTKWEKIPLKRGRLSYFWPWTFAIMSLLKIGQQISVYSWCKWILLLIKAD